MIFAFVIKSQKCVTLSEEVIMRHVHSKVIDAKKLRGGVYFVDDFPMTPSGKIQRAAMRKVAENHYKKIAAA